MTHPVRPTLKTESIPLILLAISFVAGFYFFLRFPDKVPTHWNIRGQVDGYSSRGFAAFFFPLFSLGIYLFLLVLPYADPRRERYQEFAKAYHAIKAVIVGFMTLVYFFVGLSGLGYKVSVNFVIPPALGILFIVLGIYMGKIKPNWFVGIRTPWTLSSDEVWERTHRLGGVVFVIAGIIIVFASLLPSSLFYGVLLLVVLAAAFILILYSYLLYRKLEGNTRR